MSVSLVPSHGVYAFKSSSASLPGQFKFAKLATDGTITVPGAGDLAVVLQEAVAQGASYVVGQHYTCVFEGIIKVKAGASLNAGVQVTTDSSGQAIAASSGQTINGVTIRAAASGDLVPVRVTLSGAIKP